MPPSMATEDSRNYSRAEELKALANEAFKARKYSQAIDLYTQAIEVDGDNAVYWANRAFAHTKLEEYGSAIQDATTAIEVDSRYSKGYYRRGAAYLAMGKFKEALKDFQQVKRICPNDPDATKKLKECEKAVMKLKFEDAISVSESERHSVADSIDYHTIGDRPGSSFVSLKATAVAAAVAVVAVLAVYTGAKAAIAVAARAVVMILVFWVTFWHGRRNKGVSSKGQTFDLDVEPQYTGARIGDVVTLDFVKKMMDDFKNQKCLHKRYAYQIVLQLREMLRALPSLVDINVPDGKHFTVCGDVHGQFYDLMNIFELNGLPSEDNPYLFNGDFVDRGSFSVEVILTLFAFKCMSPSAMYLSRGNHESKSMNKIYGFEGEVKSKLSDKFVELFAEVFCCLPLAHVINKKIFVVHGGLFSVDGVKLSEIRAIDRFCEPPEEGYEVAVTLYPIPHLRKVAMLMTSDGTISMSLLCHFYDFVIDKQGATLPSKFWIRIDFLNDIVNDKYGASNILALVLFSSLEGLMCELLWSDPQPQLGRGPSKRGVGLSFGADVTKRFLQDNNLDLVVRSHEVKDEGYEIEHDGKLITVFSAPNYCDQMGNKGAFIRFEVPDLKPNIVSFSAVPHPDVKPMAYANNFLRMFS